MPCYEAICSKCSYEFEYHALIKGRDKIPKCPFCKSVKTERAFRTATTVRMDQDFSSENGGKGRFIDALAKVNSDGCTYDQNDQSAYCRSQSEALEKAKHKGLKAEKT